MPDLIKRKNTTRIESLDWLRGLMAISIMAYHLRSWYFSGSNDNLLGKLGIYGVSIFFILSGLSIAIAYSNNIDSIRKSVHFFIRRIFRIWPLLWVCIILAIIYMIITGTYNLSIRTIIENFTTLFGFIRPEAYINTGAWSIGNEMVYYSLTPIIIYLYNRKLLIGNLFFILTIGISLYFSTYLLDSTVTLAQQWEIYINPFNNLSLYVAGIAIYYNLKNMSILPVVNIGLLLTTLLFFIFYSISGDQISLVTGTNRILFVIASIILVIVFYKFSLNKYVPKAISNLLEQFGIATYGVYLLHPIVNSYLGAVLRKMGLFSPILQVVLTFIFTILAALLSYNFYEKKMMKLGKKLTLS